MKMIKFILIFTIVILTISNLFGQQQSQYSQYMLNYYLINPAVSGTEDYLDIKMAYRTQWIGIDNAPKNYYVTAHTPLGKLHGAHDSKRANKKMLSHHSVGGMVNGQSAGPLRRLSGYASYAFHLPLDPKHYLSLGAQMGGIQYSLQPVISAGQDPSDATITNFSSFKPDGSVGLWFYSIDYFMGLSVTQIFDNKLDPNFSDQYNSTLNRHYYFTGGYDIKVNKHTLLIPSTLLKFSNHAFQADINAKLKYNGNIWGGLSLRPQDALVVMLGAVVARKIEVGVSYDFTFSGLRVASKGSCELVLGYRFDQNASIISPSDFW